MAKKTKIFAVLSSVLFFIIIALSITAFADNVTLTSVAPQKMLRTIYWNAAYLPPGGWDHPAVHSSATGSPSTDFSVQIPVKAGNYVEVVFAGYVNGPICGGIVLAGGSATAVSNSQCCIASGYPTNNTLLWTSYAMKTIYRATADGTLTFKQEFWQDSYTTSSGTRSCVSYFATAEIIA